MKLSEKLYDYKNSLSPATPGPLVMFFLPVEYFGEQPSDVEIDFSELQFEVGIDFVVSNNSVYKPKKDNKGNLILGYWNRDTVKSWRENDWTFEEAEDLLYRAIKEKKLVSLNFLK